MCAPSISIAGVPKEILDPCNALMAKLRKNSVICPTGSPLIFMSSPLCKNISLSVHPKSSLEPFPSRPERGAYHDRHGRWVRDAVDAAALSARWDRRAGSLGACERSTARGREMLSRTAKSCGPDAPTLASSSRRFVGPTGRGHSIFADDGGKRARSPGRARHTPLKPLRRECRVFRRTCGDYTRVLPTHCTRGCGCSGHPAFPAPSVFLGER